MDKKGLVITHLPFKKYLIFVLIVGGLWFAYYFFILNSVGLISLPKSCPNNLIPERVLLEKDVIKSGPAISPTYTENENKLVGICESKDEFGYCVGTLAKWEDGTLMKDIYGIKISCLRGNKEGENTNLFYCRSLYYSDTPVNEDGTIGKKVELKIDLVVDPNDTNEEGYKIVDYKCKS